MSAACKLEFESDDDETWGTWGPEPVPVQQAEAKLESPREAWEDENGLVEIEVEVASDDDEQMIHESWQPKTEEDYYVDEDEEMMAEPVKAPPAATASCHVANRNLWRHVHPQHIKPKPIKPKPIQPWIKRPKPVRPQWPPQPIKPQPQPIKPGPIKPGPIKPQPMKPQPIKPQPIKPQTQGHGQRPLPPPWESGVVSHQIPGHRHPPTAPRVVPQSSMARPSKAPYVLEGEQWAEKVKQEQLMKVQSQTELEPPAPIPMSHLLGSGLSSHQLIEIAGYYLDAADQRFMTEVEQRQTEEAIFNLGVEIGQLTAPEKR